MKNLITLIIILTLTSCSRQPEIERIHTHHQEFSQITDFMRSHAFAPVTELPSAWESMSDLSLNREYKIYVKGSIKAADAKLVQVIMESGGSLDFAGHSTVIKEVKKPLAALLKTSTRSLEQHAEPEFGGYRGQAAAPSD